MCPLTRARLPTYFVIDCSTIPTPSDFYSSEAQTRVRRCISYRAKDLATGDDWLRARLIRRLRKSCAGAGLAQGHPSSPRIDSANCHQAALGYIGCALEPARRT